MLATTVDFLKESGQVFLVMTGPPLRCHPWHLSANANIVFALPLRLNHFPRKSHSLRRIYAQGSSLFLLGYEKHPNYLGRAFENTCAEIKNKFCIFIKTVINVVFMKNIPHLLCFKTNKFHKIRDIIEFMKKRMYFKNFFHKYSKISIFL